jgi:hypothetical protein
MDTKTVSKLIEDLQTENGTYVERIMQLTMDVSRLKVQNDKYREALEHIGIDDDSDCKECWEGEDLSSHYFNLAREALRENK